MVKVLTDFSVENSGTESKHSRQYERWNLLCRVQIRQRFYRAQLAVLSGTHPAAERQVGY